MRNLPNERNNKSGRDWRSACRPFLLLAILAALSMRVTGCNQIRDTGYEDKDDGFSLVVDQDATLQFDRSGAVDSPRTEELQPILNKVEALFNAKNEKPVALVIVSQGSTFVDICWFNAASGERECVRIPLP